MDGWEGGGGEGGGGGGGGIENLIKDTTPLIKHYIMIHYIMMHSSFNFGLLDIK